MSGIKVPVSVRPAPYRTWVVDADGQAVGWTAASEPKFAQEIVDALNTRAQAASDREELRSLLDQVRRALVDEEGMDAAIGAIDVYLAAHPEPLTAQPVAGTEEQGLRQALKQAFADEAKAETDYRAAFGSALPGRLAGARETLDAAMDARVRAKNALDAYYAAHSEVLAAEPITGAKE